MAGDWLSLVALRSLLLELTGSGMSVSALLLYSSVPSLLVAPFAGVRAPGEGLWAGEVGGRGAPPPFRPDRKDDPHAPRTLPATRKVPQVGPGTPPPTRDTSYTLAPFLSPLPLDEAPS